MIDPVIVKTQVTVGLPGGYMKQQECLDGGHSNCAGLLQAAP